MSIVAGPPLIQSRMHERLRCGCLAASAANAGNQPAEAKPSPAETRNMSRRDNPAVRIAGLLFAVFVGWVTALRRPTVALTVGRRKALTHPTG